MDLNLVLLMWPLLFVLYLVTAKPLARDTLGWGQLLMFVAFLWMPLFVKPSTNDPYDPERSLLVPNPDFSLDLVHAHWSDPAMQFGAAYFAIAWLVPAVLRVLSRAQRNKKGVETQWTAGEARGAAWFLLNGGIIHVIMDGLTGGFGLSHNMLPLMFANYRLLDNRCREDVPYAQGGPNPGSVSTAVTVFRLELFAMAPLCLLTYWAYVLRKPFRHELEVITLTFQFIGTVFFIVPELMTGCEAVSPFGKSALGGCFGAPDPNSLYDLMYFYFAFGMNIVWLVIPALMAWSSIRESASLKRNNLSAPIKDD